MQILVPYVTQFGLVSEFSNEKREREMVNPMHEQLVITKRKKVEGAREGDALFLDT